MQTVNLKNTLVFCGEGAEPVRLLRSLLEELDPTCGIQVAGVENLAQTLVNSQCFIMPGGADLPYCKALNGDGNRLVRNFVTTGGTYLGICAGAYYAARRIEFHKGREDEICGDRELGFFPGTAAGSLVELAPYYDGTPATAATVEIEVSGGNRLYVHYHGGCCFIPDDGAEFDILARYVSLPENPACCVSMRVGEGRVILCGIHPEVDVSGPTSAGNTGHRTFWRGLLQECGLPLR